MKYYKVIDRSLDLNRKALGLVADIPSANGQFVTNGKAYFDRMGQGEIIQNTPVFDYFHLQSFGEKEEWEWRLQDVHGFMGEYPTGCAWYISDDFKLLLENFKVAPKYHFYETKLLYKGKKLKYWIFQFPLEGVNNINFHKSEFVLKDDSNSYIFSSVEEYLAFYRKEYRETKRKLRTQTIGFKDNYDLVQNTNMREKLVSENLKNAIEKMGLEGFEFSELNYEIKIG